MATRNRIKEITPASKHIGGRAQQGASYKRSDAYRKAKRLRAAKSRKINQRGK
jgi:hypothetical protein